MVQIQRCKIQQIPRSKNTQANILARLATSQVMDLSDDVHLKTLESCSIEKTNTIFYIGSKLSWIDPIVKYLKSRTFPTDHIVA